jgi:hypothetical protein
VTRFVALGDSITLGIGDPVRTPGPPGPPGGGEAADRLHPSERGHRLIARRFHALLAAAGHQVGLPPDPEPGNPPPSRGAELAWLATKGTAWVLRRSTDLVPSLLAMAFREWRYGPVADPAGPQDPDPAGAGDPRRPAPTP